jgi:peptide/nickel transport system substrate-binding protein
MTRPKMLAACAVAAAAALGLAACSSGSSGSGSINSTTGVLGSVPAASGTATAGTITWAEPPGSAPTWILPIEPGADYTVYSADDFSYESWRPLYWTQSGVSPDIDQSLSLANLPTYSNGDKTVTVTMKTSYKWTNGQPVTSQDALLYLDELRAAVHESASNWGAYSPGVGIPDQVVSASTPNATTLVLNLNKPVNPTWFTDNELALIQPMPAYAWAKASASGPTLDFTNTANATKIYNFLAVPADRVQ